MAAPVPAARTTPTGTKMGDGYQTLINPNIDPNIEFWEKSITPPGLESDEPTDISTMHNETYRNFHPRTLIRLTQVQASVEWDPILYTSLLALINVNTTWTVHFPNGDSLAFYGILTSFAPGELVEGTPPEATLTIMPSNSDPTTCEEEGPTYTAGTGTGPC